MISAQNNTNEDENVFYFFLFYINFFKYLFVVTILCFLFVYFKTPIFTSKYSYSTTFTINSIDTSNDKVFFENTDRILVLIRSNNFLSDVFHTDHLEELLNVKSKSDAIEIINNSISLKYDHKINFYILETSHKDAHTAEKIHSIILHKFPLFLNSIIVKQSLDSSKKIISLLDNYYNDEANLLNVLKPLNLASSGFLDLEQQSQSIYNYYYSQLLENDLKINILRFSLTDSSQEIKQIINIQNALHHQLKLISSNSNSLSEYPMITNRVLILKKIFLFNKLIPELHNQFLVNSINSSESKIFLSSISATSTEKYLINNHLSIRILTVFFFLLLILSYVFFVFWIIGVRLKIVSSPRR